MFYFFACCIRPHWSIRTLLHLQDWLVLHKWICLILSLRKQNCCPIMRCNVGFTVGFSLNFLSVIFLLLLFQDITQEAASAIFLWFFQSRLFMCSCILFLGLKTYIFLPFFSYLYFFCRVYWFCRLYFFWWMCLILYHVYYLLFWTRFPLPRSPNWLIFWRSSHCRYFIQSNCRILPTIFLRMSYLNKQCILQ